MYITRSIEIYIEGFIIILYDKMSILTLVSEIYAQKTLLCNLTFFYHKFTFSEMYRSRTEPTNPMRLTKLKSREENPGRIGLDIAVDATKCSSCRSNTKDAGKNVDTDLLSTD